MEPPTRPGRKRDTNSVHQFSRLSTNSSTQSTLSVFSQFSQLSTNKIGSNKNPGASGGANGASSGRDINSNETPARTRQYPIQGPSNHLCCICGDVARRKYYGAYSCASCALFFKRAVQGNLSFTCLWDKNCVINTQSRSQCEHCRYQKCQAMGMKPESVQVQRERCEREVEQTSKVQMKTSLDLMIEAERRLQNLDRVMLATEIDLAAYTELFHLVEWAKHVPHFNALSLNDRVVLLRAGWNELLILGIAYRSVNVEGALVLANGLIVNSHSAKELGLAEIFDQVLSSVVAYIKVMKWDEEELACLKSIVLFNSETPDLPRESKTPVETVHDNVFEILDDHIRTKYPKDRLRFTKLFVRPPGLRSASIKCRKDLFFNRVIPNTPIDDYLKNKLAIAAPAES